MSTPVRTAVSTGDMTLDYVLGGGFPRNRAVLVTGGPGTGKSTLSMQFLQQGLREGEDCLFVSTEQTPSELGDTFEPYDFDLEHDDLTVASIHARPGYVLDQDEEQLVVETLEGDQLVGEGYSAPFTSRYVCQLLGQYAPADRVVLDSVSGLRAMSDDPATFRRGVLDLVRLFSDEFEATSILVAEERHDGEVASDGPVDPLRYSAHGVIRLWLEEVRSDLRRFVRVQKMRGVDHDTRAYEIEFGNRGVHISPRHRNLADSHLVEDAFVPTDVPGFDELCGGGLLRGETTVIRHDGRANLPSLFLGLLKRQLETGRAVLLMAPKIGMEPERLERLFPEQPDRIQTLLDDDRLFVVDIIGQQEHHHENVFAVRQYQGGIESLFERIDDRCGETPLSAFVDTQTAVRRLDAEQVIELHRWQERRLHSRGCLTVYVHNPGLLPEEVSEFFTNSAAQALEFWRHENGLQYLTLEKSPAGYVGATRLVDHIEESPYVRIQSPPGPGVMTRVEGGPSTPTE